MHLQELKPVDVSISSIEVHKAAILNHCLLNEHWHILLLGRAKIWQCLGKVFPPVRHPERPMFSLQETPWSRFSPGCKASLTPLLYTITEISWAGAAFGKVDFWLFAYGTPKPASAYVCLVLKSPTVSVLMDCILNGKEKLITSNWSFLKYIYRYADLYPALSSRSWAVRDCCERSRKCSLPFVPSAQDINRDRDTMFPMCTAKATSLSV